MSEYLWSQRQDMGPSPRGGHALAYDAARSRTVLFGGLGPGGPLSDTWEWDGSLWTQVADTGPSPRWMHGLAYDGARTILFGGATPDDPNPSAVHADTWAWDGEHWTQVADTGPSARAAAPLAHAASGDELILFGGWSPAGFSNDTWSFTQGAWTQVADTGPSPRAWHTLGRDDHARVLLFGGADSTACFADTWAWDADAWSQIQDIGPAGRGAATGAGGLLVFGGAEGGFRTPTALFRDTWAFDGTLWVQLQDMGPSARWGAATALDGARSCVVLFGGFTAVNSTDPEASAVADTWEAPSPSPPAPGPGPQPDGEVTITAPGTFSLGSDCGFVQFQLAAPATGTEKVTVTANGLPSSIGTPSVAPGDVDGLALFSLDGLTAGDATIAVTVGAASASVHVPLVVGSSLGSLSVNPTTVTPGGTVSIILAVTGSEPVTRTAQIVFLESGLPGGAQLMIPPGATGNVSVSVAIPPSAPLQDYDVMAVSTEAGAFLVSGPMTFGVD